MSTANKIKWMFFGWLFTITLKYIIFGITAWNNALHPGLVPAPNQQPFLEPFLGLFTNM